MVKHKKKYKPLINAVPAQLKPFNIIPLRKNTKKYDWRPACPNPTCEEDFKWGEYKGVAYPTKFLQEHDGNLGVILGDPLNYGFNLVQIDVDDPDRLFKYFEDAETFIVETGRGYHLYLFTESNEPARKHYPVKDIEIRTNEGLYSVIPPSIHPVTKKPYRVYKDHPIMKVDSPTEWVKTRLNDLKDEFKKDRTYKTIKDVYPFEKDRELTEEQIDDVVTLLKPFYKPDYRNDIVYSLTGALHKEMVNFETADKLIRRLIEGDEEHDMRITVLKRTYNNEIPKNELKGFSGIMECLETQGVVSEQAKEIYNTISAIISKPRNWGRLVGSLGGSKNVVIDPICKTINYEVTRGHGKTEYTDSTLVVDAYPTFIKVIESPLDYEPRKYEVTWDSNLTERQFKTGPDLKEDVVGYLADSNFLRNSRIANDVVGAGLDLYVKNGVAEIVREIQQPGFYYFPEDDVVRAVKFDFNKPTPADVKKALVVLERLKYWFNTELDKLAGSIKWGLVSAFGYARKQKGGTYYPAIVHIGQGGTGKTTLAHVSASFWYDNPSEHEIGGGGFDSPYRMGEMLSKTTFPVIVNELAGVFDKIEMTEILKTAIEKRFSRGLMVGRRFSKIPALSIPILTSNTTIPPDSGIHRRLQIHNYTYSEVKSKGDITDFEEEFNIYNPTKSKLKKLRVVGDLTACFVEEDVSLIGLEFKEFGDTLIKKIYDYAGVPVPEWIRKWGKTETIDDLLDYKRAEIIGILSREINNVRARHLPKDAGKHEVIRLVADGGYIDWFKLYTSKNEEDMIAIGKRFAKIISDTLGDKESMRGIAELMGWGYGTIRTKDETNKSYKVIKVSISSLEGSLF